MKDIEERHLLFTEQLPLSLPDFPFRPVLHHHLLDFTPSQTPDTAGQGYQVRHKSGHLSIIIQKRLWVYSLRVLGVWMQSLDMGWTAGVLEGPFLLLLT